MGPKKIRKILGLVRTVRGLQTAKQRSKQKNSSNTSIPNEQHTGYQTRSKTAASLKASTRGCAPLEKLPSEIAWLIYQHLDLQSLKKLKRASPKLSQTTEGYKAHCLSTIRAQYAREDSVLDSRCKQGWMTITKKLHLQGLSQTLFPLDGPQYFQFLRSYSRNLHRLQRFILLVCKEKGLHLDPESLYRAILVWSRYGWTQMSQRRLAVLPGSSWSGSKVSIPITGLPGSMLEYFHRPPKPTSDDW